MWELDCEESWAPKNWCFWTVVLEKTLESPLEIQPVHSKGEHLWVFFGRNDAKAEIPVFWSPHVKSWLIGKDSNAGRGWGQEEKGTTEDEMAGWHHWLNGCESEWTLGVGDGQGGLTCCDSWGHKESDTTEQLNWTDWTEMSITDRKRWAQIRHPHVKYLRDHYLLTMHLKLSAKLSKTSFGSLGKTLVESVCFKHQSLPSIFSKTKWLKIITWNFKYISHRNDIIKNNKKMQDMYLLISLGLWLVVNHLLVWSQGVLRQKERRSWKKILSAQWSRAGHW